MNRSRWGSVCVAVSGLLLGASAGQLWQHHIIGWYLFLGGIALVGVRSLL